MEFSTISEINTDDGSTWENRVFVTFDIDWAHDEIIRDTIDLCEHAGVSATWFITHESAVLGRLRENLKFEIGIHPNFNYLLQGDPRSGKNAKEVVDRIHSIVPESTSVRSHSLCYSSTIQEIYADLGITHDSSVIIPSQNNTQELWPWKMWDGLIRVPYMFCDYVTSMTWGAKIKTLLRRNGIKVFDFHPIHVFLNTESLGRYESTRLLHQNPKELIKHRYDGYGARSRLLDLLKFAKNYQS
tara:strand:+ start:705 stop:1433 length:729 start_codon:yes stop_codon:yes gene_type:complete